MQIERNKDLQSMNTLAVPSVVSHYCVVHSLDELDSALSWAKENSLPIFVLGGGSNVILSQSLHGLLIQLKMHEIRVQYEDSDSVVVTADAGVNWHQLVEYCVAHAYCGIENLALIPGDVGAAPIQNIGAYGVELKDVFFQLEALALASGRRVKMSVQECEFAYRDSVFKHRYLGRYIITSVSLRLSKRFSPNISYPALAARFSGQQDLSSQALMNAVISIRQSKLPDPDKIPNAGSFFKNPVVTTAQFDDLLQGHPGLVAFPYQSDTVKLAAAWLIDSLGWKGREVNGVKVHPEHALVLTNPTRAKGESILVLAEKIKHSVLQAYGVELEIEPRLLSDDAFLPSR